MQHEHVSLETNNDEERTPAFSIRPFGCESLKQNLKEVKADKTLLESLRGTIKEMETKTELLKTDWSNSD